MIDIVDLLIRNFLSFGDYDTLIKLDNLRSCLIIGEVLGVPDSIPGDDDSNGAGKSVLVNAILWVFFGRTMHDHNPGDQVINWVTKRDCKVQVRLKNGDMIVRTRNGQDGHDELLYYQGGVPKSLGTNKMQQAELNRILHLDYTIFCGSAFFAQYSKPWMEMADPARKKALEREFHLDRLQYYADYAKERKEEGEETQEKHRIEITTLQHTITTLTNELNELTLASSNFDADKQQQLEAAESRKQELIANRDAIQIPNITALSGKWAIVAKAEALLNKQDGLIYGLESNRRQCESDIAKQNTIMKEWANREDTICSECEQVITAAYISTKVQTPQQKLVELQTTLKGLVSTITAKKSTIATARARLEAKKPSQTITDAKNDIKEWQRRDQAVKAQDNIIMSVSGQVNSYDQSIARLRTQIEDHQTQIAAITQQMRSIDTTILHWQYIYKAYSDRRKIKGKILCDYIPYLNERIGHYLDRFGMRLRIEFTDGIGVRSNYWKYNWFCGGERKRVDVAIMLAMFDLHNTMYGHQCNIMVLDEVDGRLDKKGARLLADIIRTDMVGKADSILIISHRQDMRGAFESEIRVQKDSPEPEGQSRIVEIAI